MYVVCSYAGNKHHVISTFYTSQHNTTRSHHLWLLFLEEYTWGAMYEWWVMNPWCMVYSSVSLCCEVRGISRDDIICASGSLTTHHFVIFGLGKYCFLMYVLIRGARYVIWFSHTSSAPHCVFRQSYSVLHLFSLYKLDILLESFW